MSVTLEKLCNQAGYLYRMKQEAGQGGIRNLVNWVHIIEDEEVCRFLRGNELVFTTGIVFAKKCKLIEFVKALYEKGASGLVINYGPYIESIPRDVIQFCNENDFPLFSIPWETRVVDMTMDFCHRIVQSEHAEENVISAWKDIIFLAKTVEECLPVLERKGYRPNMNFSMLAVCNKDYQKNASNDARLKFAIEKITSKVGDLSVTFAYEKCRIILLVNYDRQMIEDFLEELKRQVFRCSLEEYVVGVGNIEGDMRRLPVYFKRAVGTVEMCIKKEREILYYDDLGIYRILLGESQDTVLREFYNDIMLPIEKYDEENGTNLAEFIQVYLESNGSVQTVVEKMYIHRNTVNYQIGRIKKICGLDLSELEVKVKFYLCLYIRDLLN